MLLPVGVRLSGRVAACIQEESGSIPKAGSNQRLFGSNIFIMTESRCQIKVTGRRSKVRSATPSWRSLNQKRSTMQNMPSRGMQTNKHHLLVIKKWLWRHPLFFSYIISQNVQAIANRPKRLRTNRFLDCKQKYWTVSLYYNKL